MDNERSTERDKRGRISGLSRKVGSWAEEANSITRDGSSSRTGSFIQLLFVGSALSNPAERERAPTKTRLEPTGNVKYARILLEL
jgi:hypothetical protein